jgi:peptidylprolyl isomerase
LRYWLIALFSCATVVVAQDRPTMSSVLEASSDSDWRQPVPENTLYLQLESGRVVFELAPDFAPNHIANIRKLVADNYFDDLAIVRSQDNYVVQWGDPNSGNENARSMGAAAEMLDPEFYRDTEGLPFTRILSNDAYADEVGFVAGFPAGRDGEGGRAWLTHCFGMLGVGRASSPRSGNGAELYVVTGHAPRHLDRNVTLIGRVIEGMQLLTTLPRGTGPSGFFESEDEYVKIKSIRFGSELAAGERLAIELIRTDTETFGKLVEARRHRAEEWFVDPADSIGLCNVPLPDRPTD